MISHDKGNDWIVIMTDGSCSWLPVLTLPLGHIGSIYSLLVVTLYQQSNLKPQVFCSVFMLCLSSFSVLCAQCCQCFWIVFVLCLVCPMLSVSLDCLRSLDCVPNVASVSGLSFIDCPHWFSLTCIQRLLECCYI